MEEQHVGFSARLPVALYHKGSGEVPEILEQITETLTHVG